MKFKKIGKNESVTDDCTITILFRDDPEFSGSLLSKTLGAFMRNSIYVYYENQQSIYGDKWMDGIFKTIKKGAVYIDNTTASATIAREIYDYAKKNGFGSLDAPVSGGQAGAENGALTVMIGGDQDDFDKAKDKIDCYSKKMKLLGKAGCGQLAKMVNQICIAGLVQGLSEGINFGIKAGLKMEDVIEVISKGAAQSWQMENRYKTMIDDKFDFGFAVDWMRKDLKIAMDEAKNNGSLLPVTELVDKYYGEVQGMGGNRWDTSSLIKRFRK